MDIIFMNSAKSKAAYPHRLLLNLPDKIDLRRINKFCSNQIEVMFLY